jgi:hypothetical protein
MSKRFEFIKWFPVFMALILAFKLSGQPVVDSVISERNNKYQDYLQFRESLKKHTWTDLMNLKDQAGEIIKTDNTIINEYLNRERLKVKKKESEIEKLKNELKMAQKEIEAKETILTEREDFTKMLIYSLIGTVILIIIFLGIMIDRQIRYGKLKDEIERIWASAEDRDDDLYKNEELINKIKSLKRDKEKLLNRIDELSQIDKDSTEFTTKLRSEIKQLREENRLFQNSLSEKDKELKKEILTRKAVEEEIRELINKIK